MDIKEILGELYTPEIEEKLAGKNLTDLSTGDYVAKGKYESMVNKFNELNSEKVKMQEELDNLNISKMTDEQKRELELETLKKELDETNRRYNRAEIEKIYVQAGIKEDEYSSLLENVGSDNLEQSKKIANSMLSIINTRTANATQKAKEDIMKNTPEPQKGNSDNSGVTLAQFKKMSANEMIKFKEEQPELFKEYIKK